LKRLGMGRFVANHFNCSTKESRSFLDVLLALRKAKAAPKMPSSTSESGFTFETTNLMYATGECYLICSTHVRSLTFKRYRL
jgi:hypothetical protein